MSGFNREMVTLTNGDKVEADVYIEILFRNILEFDEFGSTNFPCPTLYCRFNKGELVCKDVFIDTVTKFQIDEKEIRRE